MEQSMEQGRGTLPRFPARLAAATVMQLAFWVLMCCSGRADETGQADVQKKQMDELLSVLGTKEKIWEERVQKLGRTPPDFGSFPTVAELPDPLVDIRAGQPARVQTPEEWSRQRERLKELFEYWALGHAPPAPDNLRAETLVEHRDDSGTLREVELRFGPDHRAKLWLEIRIPAGPGPFPVFMTQHELREWVTIAVHRGYITVVYAAADDRDDTDGYVDVYPEFDWSILMRRAWATSRCIDYLSNVPEADMSKIAVAGHSRYGKQSLIASAFDERISAVISSSSGTGGCMPARYFNGRVFGEGLEEFTRGFPEYFDPRLRFFAGRENKMPFDFHELVALAAPRACLLSIAYNDGVEDTWAMQQTYFAVRPVYEMLGVPERLRILWRPGLHELWTHIMERYMDWCDAQFERGSYSFPERLIYPWNWEGWRAHSGDNISVESLPERSVDDVLTMANGSKASNIEQWSERRREIRKEALNMLDAAPPLVHDPSRDYASRPNVVGRYAVVGMDNLLQRDDRVPIPGKEGKGKGVVFERIVRDEQMPGYSFSLAEVAQVFSTSVLFGDYIPGDVYAPEGLRTSGKKAPAVLFLHPFSCSMGYTAHYQSGEQTYHALAQAGYVVFCFDQIGTARRTEEIEDFYDRFPRWSLLGKMLRDSQAALDVLVTLPYVDVKQIYVVGFDAGAIVGEHLMALDERPAGFVSVCGPPPFRTDTPDKGTGGIRRWSHQRMLIPKLGLFIGHESRTPYDVCDLLASAAPRPVLVISPELDWQAPCSEVSRAVDAARGAYALYNAADRLTQEKPAGIPVLNAKMQQIVIRWLDGQTHR